MKEKHELTVPIIKQKYLLEKAENKVLLQNENEAENLAKSLLNEYQTWSINNGEMIFDQSTSLLWQGKPEPNKKDTNDLKISNLENWRLPNTSEISKLNKEAPSILKNRYPLKDKKPKLVQLRYFLQKVSYNPLYWIVPILAFIFPIILLLFPLLMTPLSLIVPLLGLSFVCLLISVSFNNKIKDKDMPQFVVVSIGVSIVLSVLWFFGYFFAVYLSSLVSWSFWPYAVFAILFIIGLFLILMVFFGAICGIFDLEPDDADKFLGHLPNIVFWTVIALICYSYSSAWQEALTLNVDTLSKIIYFCGCIIGLFLIIAVVANVFKVKFKFVRKVWMTQQNGEFDSDEFNEDEKDDLRRSYATDIISKPQIIACNALLKGKSAISMFYTLHELQFSYEPMGQFDFEKVQKMRDFFVNVKSPLDIPIKTLWTDLDYITTRLPKIDNFQFTDENKGMWEFFCPPQLKSKYTKTQTIDYAKARNPALDVQTASVAIDFGTSSTVVAIRKNGVDEILRIGMQAKDFLKNKIRSDDYENPTVLELINLKKFLQEWRSESYRPLVDWDNIHCSHEARNALRHNNSDIRIVGSILERLKQWALRTDDQAVQFRDQQGTLYTVDSLKELDPVKGMPIEITENYPEFDPIEVYAWFLGMNINWRERGLYLNYYLTFPVDYPSSTKEKILSSFRRGLQRSLPESLIYDEKFNDFSVEALASEPAAFAAVALKHLNIVPKNNSIAYSIFDFGGGTTDFDFGFYLNANAIEEQEGWDDVIEHFGAAGDKFLGGENLLANLAYLVFQRNSAECQAKNIAFTKPIDAPSFSGSERLIEKTQAAYTNTTILMSKLRPLWEKGINPTSEGKERFKLIDRNGNLVDVNIEIQQKPLMEFLENRICEGLNNFFIAMKSAFKNHSHSIPSTIHVLLAGNSSRSKIVQGILGLISDDRLKSLHEELNNEIERIFEHKVPEFIYHEPLYSDQANSQDPTAKTGVALGLLRLVPGERLKVINHSQQTSEDSPFQYFVGTFKRDMLQVAVHRGAPYQEWFELGKPLQGMFIMGYTTLPKAAIENTALRGEAGLFEQTLKFAGNTPGQFVFAKIISPNEIEVCTASSLEVAQQNQGDNTQMIQLG